MITIGIRAAPKAVTFAVYNSDGERIINIGDIKVPAALSVPRRLKYVRCNVLDVLREYQVQRAGIRETEPSAQSSNIDRIRIESVLQEAFASSDLEKYYVGQIASISARIGIDRTDFKPLVNGTREYKVDDWSTLTAVRREAVLCAVGAVNA
jgi:hypothetical protein